MDRLNDDLHKKDLGAFYTHTVYAEKSLELVRKAIERVPGFREIIYILLIYRIVEFSYFYLSNKTVTQTSFFCYLVCESYYLLFIYLLLISDLKHKETI